MFLPAAFAARACLLAACLLVAFEASAQASRHFLWEVTSLTNRVYLFGTVHAGKKDWYPLPAEIEDAFADSKVLVVEADVTDVEAMQKTTAAMVYPPPDTLRNHVPAADYERFRKQLARFGLPEAQLVQLKPFMAVSVLVFSEWARLGYVPQHGVDPYLIRKAKADVKRIVEIEGVEQQVRLMDSLTDAEHRQIFDGTLRALEGELTAEQITGMVNAWQAGDPALMLEIAQRYNDSVPGAKEFEEKFVWARHQAMADKIEGYMNDSRDRHFIAVGSLHLAGPRGLIEMLRQRGYVVRQR
ncbi:MAG TPA: TraB/GumN family protein [Usitatibacter sp.]|nr:TraB/GumN family protein [Usitatibacter sp.]